MEYYIVATILGLVLYILLRARNESVRSYHRGIKENNERVKQMLEWSDRSEEAHVRRTGNEPTVKIVGSDRSGDNVVAFEPRQKKTAESTP